jgi:Tfp pilus assembly protein PilN
MRAVNLIPADRRGSRRASPFAALLKSPLLALAVAAMVVAVAFVAVEIQSATSTVTSRQQTLRDLDAQVAKLPKPKPTGSGTSATSRLSVLAAVANQRTTWDSFLSTVSRVMPEDVWLVNMSASAPTVSSPTTSPTTASAGFTVSGYTYTQPSVARLMRRLRLVPWLSGISLTTSSKTSLDNRTLYQFTLGANVISLPEVGS